MAAVLYDRTYQTANDVLSAQPIPFAIKNATQLYVGYFVDLEAATGELIPHAAAGVVVGYVLGPGNPGNDPNIYPVVAANTVMPVGNTTTNPDAPVCALVETGAGILQAVDVEGTVGSFVDQGKKVWAADASTLTVTDPGGGEKPIGSIDSWNPAGSNFNVALAPWLTRKV